MQKIFTTCVLLVFMLLVVDCGVSKNTIVQRSYMDTKKKPEEVQIPIEVPVIELIKGTTQLQKKGGVTVTCEIIPFEYKRIEKQVETVADLDPTNPAYDVFEIMTTPEYHLTPGEFQFNIKIRNNQDRVLKLVEVPIILIVDGIQTSIEDKELIEWKGTLIVKGFEKEFLVKGPKINALKDAKSVYIGVHDVPISYDPAGNVKKKENFEWTFSIRKENSTKNDRITYGYDSRPIYKEQCKACGGSGDFIESTSCYQCKGSGTSKNKEGKIVKCSSCGGTGKINVRKSCGTCYGKGILEFPKSQMPPVTREVVWTGWNVRVETIPAGANIKIVDTKTSDYKNSGRSNLDVNWYQCSGKECPIIIEMKDKALKVLPFNKEGTEIGKILVDFSDMNMPKVIEGQLVHD